MNELIQEVDKILNSMEDNEQKTLYLYDTMCSLNENQRLEFFKSFTVNSNSMNELKFMIENVLFLMHTVPIKDRFEFIKTLKNAQERSFWAASISPEYFVYLLEGIPEENWPDLFAIVPVLYEEEQFKNYFLFSLFNEAQIKIISQHARYAQDYRGNSIKIQGGDFKERETFDIWRDTLISINELFHDNEKFLTYLKPLDDEIAKISPDLYESAPSERIYDYHFPSTQDYKTKPRQSYDRVMDELFLETERPNGLNKKDTPYFNGVIPASEIETFLRDYPRSLFKEIVSSTQILLHGHNIHRLQWYVIQSAVQKGDIKLPPGKTIADLYDVFMNVGYADKKIWDTLIDRPRYFSSHSLQNPERMQSYLLTAPEVKQALPYFNQYMENSFFKKIDRIFTNKEKAVEEYGNLIRSSVNQIFHDFYEDATPEYSFQESIQKATSSNEKRIVSKYGSATFFKQAVPTDGSNKQVNEDDKNAPNSDPKITR